MMGGVAYRILFVIVRAAMFLYHPVFRVIGREHVPKEGRLLICPNHSGAADPIWVIFALRLGHIPRIMAKKELMKFPLFAWIFHKLGVFTVLFRQLVFSDIGRDARNEFLPFLRGGIYKPQNLAFSLALIL